MHEQDSLLRTISLRARHSGLLQKPSSHSGGGSGASVLQKIAGFLGGFLGSKKQGQDGKGSGNSSPQHPGSGEDGRPRLPTPAPQPGKGSGANPPGGGSGAATSTDLGAANAGSAPSGSTTPGSPSASALSVSTTSTPRRSPSSNRSTSQLHSGTLHPSLPLSASAPPAQSPTVAPGPSASSTAAGDNQPNSGGKKSFPLAAAGVLGAVLSFLVVSAIVWGLWYILRARRRRRQRPPEWDFNVRSAKRKTTASSRFTAGSGTLSTSASTIPYFISADEAGHREVVKRRSDSSFEHAIPNPFAHTSDEGEIDPFASDEDASMVTLRRENTHMTRSTMSV